MTPPVGGVDPRQDTFTLGIVDANGVELTHETYDNTAAGYGAAIDLLDAHGVCQVGVEGSAKWGAHVGIALAAAGFDAREVPASRSAAQRRLEHPDPAACPTPAGKHRLAQLQALIDQGRTARREVRRLERLIDDLPDRHGTTPRDEPGIGPISAAVLLCEVGDPARFDRESKFARWCGTGAVALSSGEGSGQPVKHRLDFRGNRRVNSALHIASVTQARSQPDAAALPRPQNRRKQDPTRSQTSPQTPPRQPRHPTHAARRKTPTTHPTSRCLTTPLDKGASDRPGSSDRIASADSFTLNVG